MITVKTLHKATAQEVFDQIAEHLLKQGRKSQSHSAYPSCKYRGPEGLRCAAGCLIGDDEYDATFEGKVWFTVARLLSPECGEGAMCHAELISNAQEIHDLFQPEDWRTQLSRLASKFDLNLKFDSTDL